MSAVSQCTVYAIDCIDSHSEHLDITSSYAPLEGQLADEDVSV